MEAKEMDALEVSIRLQLGNIAKSRQLTETVVAHGPTLLELIAAARELEELKSAMSFLNDGQRCGSAILACDRILAWAIEAGWEQTK